MTEKIISTKCPVLNKGFSSPPNLEVLVKMDESNKPIGIICPSYQENKKCGSKSEAHCIYSKGFQQL